MPHEADIVYPNKGNENSSPHPAPRDYRAPLCKVVWLFIYIQAIRPSATYLDRADTDLGYYYLNSIASQNNPYCYLVYKIN